MLVTKRDGRKVKFDEHKIINAIEASFRSVDGEVTQEATDKAQEIAKSIADKNKDYSVEEIQDIVEQKLMASKRKDVAKAYILYRNDRTKHRQYTTKLMRQMVEKLNASNVQNQNANVDEHSFGGRKGEADSVIMKQYALDNCVSEMARNNHINNEIYIHDLDSYAVGQHNCLSVPLDDLLANGFNTRQTDIRPAGSVNTAFQLVAVLFQIQSLQQFGGVAATHLDWTMVPYVRKSFRKHFKDGMYYIENTSAFKETSDGVINTWKSAEEMSIDAPEYKMFPKAYQYAMDMTIKETKQAVEGFLHNMNSLQSRSGNQLPFSSANYGTCTLPEGRMVIKALLEGSLNGVGKHHRTSIFPCGIFQYKKGVNDKPGTPNYDMYQLALKSTAKRLYPNYANCDWSGNAGYDPNDPKSKLEEIKTEKEWKVIDTILKTLQEEITKPNN